MSWGKEFVELSKSKHDRDSFDCGEQELNTFIKTQAAKRMQAGISRTMVLPSAQPLLNQKFAICVFYSVAPSSISRETLPAQLAKKLPRYPIPVFLLAQLAVHKEYHGSGLGKISLIRALKYLWEVNHHMRVYAIVVDCLTDSAQAFYTKFGFEVLCEYNERIRMFLPMKTVEQLFNQ
ncbi:N-acetyltransferase [Vibrio anguillarum]|uniref:N-acetyltransferase n=4 Tax=Vibrio anguillarum TaxID=55601 RepID=A0A7U5NDE7_VIBAN|nr:MULTISPECIES: GNAT family N-acetyltransferase [Vibrio]ASW82965.1 N-acetyltransferase [Vibrio anguillarum]AXN05113.1 N-acetyltransferase [Vibrio anguillarum]AZS27142.1 N-acetyltransferase [Vibrio anguillarum]MBF4308382.1 N-acetyltransferase [Vibrio anguillarum]MBF4326726.1 N-acetyltransferase [Vibrio anguillarum]